MSTPEERLRAALGEMRWSQFQSTGSVFISSTLCPGRVYELRDDGYVYVTDPCAPNDRESWLCLVTFDEAGNPRTPPDFDDMRTKYLLIVHDELRFVAEANPQMVDKKHWAHRYQIQAERRRRVLQSGGEVDDRPLAIIKNGQPIWQQ